MVDQPRVTIRARHISALVLMLSVANLSAQSSEWDLSDFAKARSSLGEHRLPADEVFHLELELRGAATGEKTQTLISSANEDWLLAADISGSWRWQAKAGNSSLSYAPTAARQPLYDENWHTIGFSLHPARREARPGPFSWGKTIRRVRSSSSKLCK